MDLAALDAELRRDEGEKLFVYDDASATAIKSGVTVRGVPTISIGVNLLSIDQEESTWLYQHRRDRTIQTVTNLLPWFSSLDDVRQRALVNLYYNVPAFIHWPNFMGFCEKQDWESAASELENTEPWINQVGARGHRIADMIRTGVAQ